MFAAKMITLLHRLFKRPQPRQLPAIAAGQRVYAIGDVHGHLDLLIELCQAIEEDERQRPEKDTTVIFLGDLIDRGPDSAGVLKWVRHWSQSRNVRIISGNHEQMFLLSFYEANALESFLRYGGSQTLASYGIDPEALLQMTFEDAQAEMERVIPHEDRDFVGGFESAIEIDDYLFVHAGIRPNVPLAEQKGRDFRWIREPFISHTEDHERYVVHGHTIFDEIDVQTNRIGVDTGAYRTGTLSALCLELTEKRVIQTQRGVDQILITKSVLETPSN